MQNSSMVVMKFGGTSLGSPEVIRHVAGLIADESSKRPVAVIVSAMSQVTNRLLATLKSAAHGDSETVERNLSRLRGKHFAACDSLVPAPRRDEVRKRMETILDDFARIAHGMLLLGEQPLRSVDEAAPTGERLSALLLSERLRALGVSSTPVSGADCIVTDAEFGSALPDMEGTTVKAGAVLSSLLSAGTVPVITGFNGATPDGTPTTLGRGGSDYSGAIVAAALDVAELWIWTDVDGILSCDPSIAANARLLTEVTYSEAAELSYNGAKVLHPRTLTPLAERAIPVRIRNTFRPERAGTKISDRPARRRGVRAITSLASVSLIAIEASQLSMSGAQLMARALVAVARAKVEVLLLTRSSFRHNFCMLVRTGDVSAALEGLREELALELAHGYLRPIDVDHSVGLLAAVGEGMRGTPGLAGRLFTAISERQVNIIAIAQGSSELTIAIVVNERDLRTAASAIHSECELGCDLVA